MCASGLLILVAIQIPYVFASFLVDGHSGFPAVRHGVSGVQDRPGARVRSV